jgi:hypothetical protein
VNGIAAVLIVAILIAWRVLVLGTCTYLVFWEGHSGWWFLLAILLCAGSSE